ncbi:MAG: PD-(D/E)XK nuclease family protein, partial [Candidatus Krumholzibacteria bacterium]|nr:PD-(D/E)XK nuclease family protein [Candidatus Krumholzibacteria bacterium]
SKEESHRFARKTLGRLDGSGFELKEAPRTDGAERNGPATVLMSAPGENEEVRGIVRMILGLVRDRGVRFGEIGVLLPSPDLYWPLLKEALDEAGVPYFAGERSLAGSAGARGALRLLRLLRGRIERRHLVDFLVSAPLSVPGGPDGGFDPYSLWVRKSAEAGMIGENGWAEENGRLIDRIKRARDGGGGVWEKELASARIVRCVLKRIAEAGAAFSGRSTWGDLAASFSSLIKDLFNPTCDTDSVCSLVEGLRELDRVSRPVSIDTFSRIVESVIGMSRRRHGRLCGRGVNVLPLYQARGISFKVLFIPGLTESGLPGTVRQDPFLKDEERMELRRITGGRVSLAEKMERLDEEELVFAMALDSATEELVLSHPRLEEGTGRGKIPSSALRFVKGYSIDGGHDESITELWLSHRVKGSAGFEPLSEGEYDFIQAAAFKEGSGSLPADRFFTKGIELVRARGNRRRFTPYDGVFSSRDAIGELRRMIEENGWSYSPTSMESYASCPFAYFLGSVLGVDSLEEPERIISITPLQKGSLVHAILAQLYRELGNRGLLPLDEIWGEEVFRIADRVASAYFSTYPENEPVGLEVFWEMEKRTISESIKALLEKEMSKREGYVPHCFEEPFGGRKDHTLVAFECGGRQLFFHGRIDRIDLGSGELFRVIDYKTGRLIGRDQDVAGGTFLQLPIYLLAASKILDRPIAAGIAQYWRVGMGEGKRRVSFSGGLWDAEELRSVLDVITRGIEGGLFFAPAAGDACKFCSMRPACPSGRGRLFEAKSAGDERCRDFISMRGLAEGEA